MVCLNSLIVWMSFIQKQPSEVFYKKKVFFKILQNSQETTVPESLFWKSCRPESCNFIKKEALAQEFACEFCETFKNTFFTEHLWVNASGHSLALQYTNIKR